MGNWFQLDVILFLYFQPKLLCRNFFFTHDRIWRLKSFSRAVRLLTLFSNFIFFEGLPKNDSPTHPAAPTPLFGLGFSMDIFYVPNKNHIFCVHIYCHNCNCTVRAKKQIRPFVFWEKLWLDNFVLRSTDLQQNNFSTK